MTDLAILPKEIRRIILLEVPELPPFLSKEYHEIYLELNIRFPRKKVYVGIGIRHDGNKLVDKDMIERIRIINNILVAFCYGDRKSVHKLCCSYLPSDRELLIIIIASYSVYLPHLSVENRKSMLRLLLSYPRTSHDRGLHSFASEDMFADINYDEEVCSIILADVGVRSAIIHNVGQIIYNLSSKFNTRVISYITVKDLSSRNVTILTICNLSQLRSYKALLGHFSDEELVEFYCLTIRESINRFYLRLEEYLIERKVTPPHFNPWNLVTRHIEVNYSTLYKFSVPNIQNVLVELDEDRGKYLDFSLTALELDTSRFLDNLLFAMRNKFVCSVLLRDKRCLNRILGNVEGTLRTVFSDRASCDIVFHTILDTILDYLPKNTLDIIYELAPDSLIDAECKIQKSDMFLSKDVVMRYKDENEHTSVLWKGSFPHHIIVPTLTEKDISELGCFEYHLMPYILNEKNEPPGPWEEIFGDEYNIDGDQTSYDSEDEYNVDPYYIGTG